MSPQGASGPAGAAVLNGAGAPSNGSGSNGDFYLDTTNTRLYGPKASGSWPGGYVSLIGAAGTSGAAVLNGAGAPSNGTGANGDFYLDTTNTRLYGPKASGAWPGGYVSLIGAAGSDATVTAANVQAAGAQMTSIGFLNRFGRLANTTAVANGSTPEVGENVFIHWGAGSANPTVQNEALEAAAGTLIYYGANVATPNQRISVTVWVELRLNASYTTGVTAPDLTFGINANAWNSTLGLAGFLNSPQCFHGQVRSTGAVNANPYDEAPSIDGDDGTTAFSAQLIGKKFPIRVEIDGATDVCRMTVAGRTRVFRDSRYSRMIGAASSGFFVEWGAPDSATQYYWCVHTIAVNAPELEDSATFEGGHYGQMIHDLQTRSGTTSIPGLLRFLNGASGFNANQAPGAADPLGIVGNPMLGHAPYAMPAPFLTSRLGGIIQRNTVALASGASASDAVLHSIARMESLASSTGANFSAGAFFRTTYIGRFGANANNKRIKVVRSAGGATRFDSGVLTANGEQFTLVHYEIRLAAGYIFITSLEWSDAAGLVKRIQTYNASAATADNQLLVTGTTAGDVTVDFHFTECHPVP